MKPCGKQRAADASKHTKAPTASGAPAATPSSNTNRPTPTPLALAVPASPLAASHAAHAMDSTQRSHDQPTAHADERAWCSRMSSQPRSSRLRVVTLSSSRDDCLMVRDFEREEHVYTPGLRLRSLRFVSDCEIELDFEGIGTEDRVFVARCQDGAIPLINFDREFERRFRGTPCINAGNSLSPLVSQMFAARRDQLPADESWDRAMADCIEQVARQWHADHGNA